MQNKMNFRAFHQNLPGLARYAPRGPYWALPYAYRYFNTAHMEKAYPFDPISSAREIRMLTLNPAKNRDPITCTLSHVSLDESPEYEALSYTWDTDSTVGTRQDTKTISCSGHTILIRENLFAALRRLRYPDRPRSLWIDAICINQAKNVEKSQQVALMGSIYANAKEVVIWLGEEEADDAMAFDTIACLKRIFENETAESDLFQQMRNSAIPMPSGNEWRAFSGLLQKRWFSRAWIVQEVALARSATLVCGGLTFDWETFLLVMFLVQNSVLKNLIYINGPPRGIAAMAVISMISNVRDLQLPLALFDLLVYTCGLQATDSRDKIFSSLSLLGFTGEDKKAKKLWSLDYDIPIDELFQKVTAYYLLDEGRFEFLSLVNHGSHLDEHVNATWMLPRYIPPEYSISPLGVRLQTTRKMAKPTGRYPYDNSHPSHISIYGVLVDQIEAVGTVIEESQTGLYSRERLFDDGCRVHRYISECESMYSELAGLSNGDVPCLTADAFWRTLICNATDSSDTPGPEYGRMFSIFREGLRRVDEYVSTGRNNWSSEDIESMFNGCMPFEISFQTWNHQRNFCTTKGKRLGMVPRAARKGDIICAFLGAITPFVLRPDGCGNYRLVGECYVQGLMYGESADLPGFLEKLEDIVLI